MKHIKISFIFLAAITVVVGSCKKSYLETTPSNAVSSENLFSTTASAYQLIDGIARVMNTTQASYTTQDANPARANDFGESAVRLENDCLGQDLVRTGAAVSSYDWFYYCSTYVGIRQPTYNVAQLSFRLYFNIINAANLLLDGVDQVTGDQAVINNLKGQAFAFRAYSYYKASIFYCKTYIGADGQPQSDQLGLPLYLSGTQASTKGKPRSTLGELYKQIVSDLDSAKYYLEAGEPESGRPSSDITKPVLYGITAEVALVMHDWQKAYDFSDLAITTSSTTLMSTAQFKQGFNSKNNPEWMWSSNLSGTQRASMGNQNFFSFVDNRVGYSVLGINSCIAKKTLDVMQGFNDVRAQAFDANRAQTKFRLADPSSWTFDLLYMRVAEMYLIKAEALARLNRESEAISVLETLVKARNPDYIYSDKFRRYTTANSSADGFTDKQYKDYYGATQSTELLREIYLQRRIELFLEGFAYADIQRLHCGLKRPTGIGNFSPGKTIKADDVGFLFKIPQQELDANPAMRDQQNP